MVATAARAATPVTTALALFDVVRTDLSSFIVMPLSPALPGVTAAYTE